MRKYRPGLVIAGTNSNCGKTTAAIGLISALRKAGLAIQPAKAGPDFLDAAWLAKAAGRPCLNLDAWMAEAGDIQELLAQWPERHDMLVVEGAMGLYDGAGDNSASTAQLAAMLNLPVVLLINANGMGQSIAALAGGFLAWGKENMLKEPRFCGIICSHVGSPRHKLLLAEALAAVCAKFGVLFLGCLPCQGAPQIPSRHLGLKQACEMDLDFAAAGEWFAANVDMAGLLQNATGNMAVLNMERSGKSRSAPRAEQQVCVVNGHFLATRPTGVESLRGSKDRNKGETVAKSALLHGKNVRPDSSPIVAIARDEAFAFCYADLPMLLEQFGAEVVYFSPLRDAALPACTAVYLPGGYPELYARELAANAGMLAALREFAVTGQPIYGECGGYIYMLEALVDAGGQRWPMSGLLPGLAGMGSKLAALGYRSAFSRGIECGVVYGHEFHYAAAEGERCQPLWHARNARGEDAGQNGQRLGNVAGSWIHLYPAGSKSFWRQWLKLARGLREMGEMTGARAAGEACKRQESGKDQEKQEGEEDRKRQGAGEAD